MAHEGQEDFKRGASKSELRTNIVRKPSGTLPGHSQIPPGNYLGTKGHEDTKSDSKRPPERTQDQDSSGPPPGPSQTLPGSYFGTNLSIVELHRAANFYTHAWTHLLQHAIGIRRKRRRSHALA